MSAESDRALDDAVFDYDGTDDKDGGEGLDLELALGETGEDDVAADGYTAESRAGVWGGDSGGLGVQRGPEDAAIHRIDPDEPEDVALDEGSTN